MKNTETILHVLDFSRDPAKAADTPDASDESEK